MKIDFFKRRTRVQNLMPMKSILLLPNFPLSENREANCDFYYLTGFVFTTEVIAFLTSEGDFGLIAERFGYNCWNGDDLSQAKLKKQGVLTFYAKEELNSLLKNYSKILISEIPNTGFNYLKLALKEAKIEISPPFLKVLRMQKETNEVNLLKKAARITYGAFLAVGKNLKASLYEGDLIDIFTSYLKKRDSVEAFNSIVGGGKNATILHYQGRKGKLKAGDLVLIDAGASFKHYACDVTRVFPVSGYFSREQKLIYRLVLKVQQKVIKAIKPGIFFRDLAEIADLEMAKGLSKLGILKKAKDLPQFTLHGIGHWLGLAVHDEGDYRLPLKPGMVLTVEPGVYFTNKVDKKWRNLGIRIEDVVLVTEKGRKVLTARIPKTINSIERFLNQI